MKRVFYMENKHRLFVGFFLLCLIPLYAQQPADATDAVQEVKQTGNEKKKYFIDCIFGSNAWSKYGFWSWRV